MCGLVYTLSGVRALEAHHLFARLNVLVYTSESHYLSYRLATIYLIHRRLLGFLLHD